MYQSTHGGVLVTIREVLQKQKKNKFFKFPVHVYMENKTRTVSKIETFWAKTMWKLEGKSSPRRMTHSRQRRAPTVGIVS